VGKEFVCETCGWKMNRQHNAALNILKTALASDEALARAVRFQPGALRNDVVNPLWVVPALLANLREELSGAESVPLEDARQNREPVTVLLQL
jgi:hypothetical protein